MEDAYKTFFESDTERKHVFGSYSDLAAYGRPPYGIEVLRVGWIGKDFQTAEIALTAELQSAMEKLRKLICISYACTHLAHSNFTTGVIRGPAKRCPVCYTGAPKVHCQNSDVSINAFEIWIPSRYCVYASPGLILHYVEDHGYVPPQAFVNAILDINENIVYDAEEHFMNIKLPGDLSCSYFRDYLRRLNKK